MRRSKQMQNKRRRLQSNTSGGEMVKPSPDVESGGARINLYNKSQESPVAIIKSKKKLFRLKQESGMRRKGEK